jgi:ribosomal protein S18 acetylase RimI-like enzyme
MISIEKKAGSSKDPVWRPASASDLDAISRIAGAIHLDLPESPEVFAEKLSLFPKGCFALVWHEEVVGYGLSHSWMLNSIPPLDTFLKYMPSHANCLYIHDVAVLPKARGHGSAGLYLELMVERARKIEFDFLALVSVYHTHSFWAKYGFEITSAPLLSAKLQSYGPTAKYMTRNLISP